MQSLPRQVDFLPESYRKKQKRKHRVLRQWLLIAAVAAGLAGATLWQDSGTDALERYALSLEEQVEAVRNQQDETGRLVHEFGELDRQRSLQRELTQPIDTTRVIDAVAAATPGEVALLRMEIEAERPAPEPPDTAGGKKSPLKLAGKSAGKDKPELRTNRLNVEVRGLAEDSAAVTEMVRRLEQQPLFTRVVLHSTSVMERAKVRGRAFHLEAEVDLNRELIDPEPQPLAGGVAHAD